MIVFGRNPNYPNVLTNNLPALEDEPSSLTVSENMKAMFAAREAFIESECSEKIKRALRHKVRTCNEAFFENGDKVFYKRNDNQRWRRPRIVIGQENKTVLVKHGGEHVRFHPVSLIHAKKVEFTSKPIAETAKRV